MRGEANADMVDHMDSMLGSMPSAPSIGNSLLMLQDGAVEGSEVKGRKGKGRAAPKKVKADANGGLPPDPADDGENGKKLPKEIVEAKLLEAMVSNPADYIRQWQKSVIADLGIGTTLIEQLQLQACMVEWTFLHIIMAIFFANLRSSLLVF